MFVKLVLATGKKSYGPLHRAVWNMEAPKEIKWSQDALWPSLRVTLHQLHRIFMVRQSALFNVGGHHTGHEHKEVRITGGHYHNSVTQDFGEPVIESYHSNSHPVCILHPSECEGIKSISLWLPSPYLLRRKKIIIIQCDNEVCSTSSMGKRLREPKEWFPLSRQIKRYQVSWTLNNQNTDWNKSRFLPQ